MKHDRLIFAARVGGRELLAVEPLHGVTLTWTDQPERGEILTTWTLRGRKVRAGSLTSSDTESGVIRRAIRGARDYSPKATIHVAWCAPCGVGREPGRVCSHVAEDKG